MKRKSEDDMISAPGRNVRRTVLSELPNAPIQFNSHYHRLEVQSPNTLLQRRKNEAIAKKSRVQARAKLRGDIVTPSPGTNLEDEENVISFRS